MLRTMEFEHILVRRSGDFGGRYPQREQMFCKQLQTELPDAQVTGDCAGFSRAQAREVVAAHLRRLDAAGRRLHAVFCTNDEMALGAVDALLFAGITCTGTPSWRAWTGHPMPGR
jgi:ABC-type sugar transport system substrate-binding protein